MNALVPVQQSNAEVYRASTDAADLCREIVTRTAMEIQDRRYVKVEGWQAIAIAHGCTGSARDVERVEGGVRAIGEIRRMSDGALIAQAEGFVGEDEPVWFGGVSRFWHRRDREWKEKTYEKRPDYAIRAMAQTRAISRACRSAFAHVVVMIDAGLSTTPAEEVPLGGFDDEPGATPRAAEPKAADQKSAPTLRERTDAFLADARACDTEMKLSRLADSDTAVRLKRDLDRSDPELGVAVAGEIGRLFDELAAPPKRKERADAEEVFV